MTDRENDGVWRDEERLPVADLSDAMATWDTDGQGDPTDNDAGQEQAFGHGASVDALPVVAPDGTHGAASRLTGEKDLPHDRARWSGTRRPR